jgi:2-polyprenyl-3-methyl-5-hydroxy-6-metoxy-1,4-benzoquinol methylase
MFSRIINVSDVRQTHRQTYLYRALRQTMICMVDFSSVYRGAPPWDIGRPQKEFVRLEGAGEIVGSVLDVGCGTGENALFLAVKGHVAWGVDFTPIAIEKARYKATERNLNVTFLTQNALELHTLGRTFDTVVD